MLTQTGHAKVMDFGLAKQLIPFGGMESAAETVTALTSDGSTVGTLAYMSPEPLRSHAVDGRSDIWALGVTLYEMVAGVRPFQGQSGVELTTAIMSQAPRPLPSKVPAEVGAVIGRCLEKEPGKRYQQAREVRAALEAIRAGTTTSWAAWRYRLARRRALALAAIVTLVALVAALVALVALDVGGLRRRLTGGSARAIRLAVLPFENRTGDPEQEYLSDGITDEMIVSLGRLKPSSLEVIGRTSVMRYKKRNTPIDEIGRALRLDYVLEGSAQREADRIRINAALIQVRGQTQRWAETYDKKMADIVALQSDVAKQVAAALAIELLPAAQVRLANARAVNPEAYEAWLKGTQAWGMLTREGMEAAERYFTLALEKDPTYAAAWAGIARVWNGRQQMGITPPREAVQNSKAAALNALALDANAWEAHRALAGILTWTDWDWVVAEREWNRLLELNPNSDVLALYSHFLMHTGRPAEAMAQIRRALDLDPFYVVAQSFYAQDLLYVRRYDDAIAAARTALDLQAGAPVATTALSGALFMKGRHGEELALEKQRWARDPELLAALERGSADAGYAGA